MATFVSAAGFAFLLLGWILPNHFPPWVSFHLEAASFAGIIFVVVAELMRQSAPIQLPRATLLLLVLPLIPWGQRLAGLLGFAGDAFAVTLYVLAAACALAAGYLSERRSSSTRLADAVLAMVAAAALVSSAIALMQWFGWDTHGIFVVTLVSSVRPFANLAQPNHLGTLILMGLIGLLYQHEHRRVSGLVLVVTCGLLILGMWATQSRTAVLGWAVVAVWWLVRSDDAGFRLSRKYFLLLSTILIGGFFCWGALSEAMLLSPVREMAVTSSNGRFGLWHQLFSAVLEAPLFGFGWLQTAAAQSIVAPSIATSGFVSSYSHNLVIDMLVWNGVPLGLLLLAVAARVLRAGFSMRGGRDPVLYLAALIPLIVHSLLEFPFAYSYFLLPAALLAGSVAAHRPTTQVMTVPKAWCVAVVSATAVLGGAMAVEYLQMEEDFRVVRFASMRVGSTEAAFRPTPAVFNTQLAAMLTMGLQPARPGMAPADIDSGREVVRRYPWPALMFRQIVALGLNGRPEEAQRLLGDLRALHGEAAYQQAREDLQRVKAQDHPQLVVPEGS